MSRDKRSLAEADRLGFDGGGVVALERVYVVLDIRGFGFRRQRTGNVVSRAIQCGDDGILNPAVGYPFRRGGNGDGQVQVARDGYGYTSEAEFVFSIVQ